MNALALNVFLWIVLAMVFITSHRVPKHRFTLPEGYLSLSGLGLLLFSAGVVALSPPYFAQWPLGLLLYGPLTVGGLGFLSRRRGGIEKSRGQPDAMPGHWFGILLTGLIGAALWLRLRGIGDFGIIIDEHWHMEAAVGYLRSGQFLRWDFFTGTLGDAYTRAWPFTLQVAGVLDALGVSLGTARYVSLAWGMVLFIPFLLYARILNLRRWQILLACVLLALSPYQISNARWVRMYSMFAVLFLGTMVVGLCALRARDLPERALWGGLSLTLGLAGLLVHKLILLLVPVGLIHGWVEAERPTAPWMWGAGALGLATLGMLGWIAGTPSNTLPLLGRVPSVGEIGLPVWFNLLYGDFLLHFLLGPLIGGLAIGCLIVYVDRTPAERFARRVLIVALVVLMFSSRRPPQIRYVGFLIPVLIPLLILGLSRLIETVSLPFRGRSTTALVTLLCLAYPLPHARANLEFIWQGHVGFLSFPYRQQKGFLELEQFLVQRVEPSDRVLLYDVPSYHAARIREHLPRTRYLSGLEDTLSVPVLRSMEATDAGGVWVVIAKWYRPPLSRPVRRHLNRHYEPAPLLFSRYLRILHRPNEHALGGAPPTGRRSPGAGTLRDLPSVPTSDPGLRSDVLGTARTMRVRAR